MDENNLGIIYLYFHLLTVTRKRSIMCWIENKKAYISYDTSFTFENSVLAVTLLLVTASYHQTWLWRLETTD